MNQLSVLYHFPRDWCDVGYAGDITQHLFLRVAIKKISAIGKHVTEAHGGSDLLSESRFKILKKSVCFANLAGGFCVGVPQYRQASTCHRI